MDDPTDHQKAIEALEARLVESSHRTEPVAWAMASYRLGLARAESPSGRPEENLGAALALYEDAASVLTEERAPLENARVVNAAGSAQRLLGNPERGVELFARASRLLEGRGGDAERAGVLSNLGLAHTDCGDPLKAVEAFDAALTLLVADDAETRRARVATRHNLAQALMSTGGHGDLADAIESLTAADAESADADSPLHQAMVWHSLGVAHKGQAEHDAEHRGALLDQAIGWFDQCLTIFGVSAFPFQHAVAKQNLGLALAGRGDIHSARRALICYEDALAIFDPRLHGPHWRATFSNMEAIERRLAAELPGHSKHDHFATLLGGMDEIERLAALRRRLAHVEQLPPRQRLERLSDLAHAVVRQPALSFVATLRTTIMVLMELPDDLLRSALEAQLVAHGRLEPHDRRNADFVLDEAIDALLFGPQRIRVRDLLSEIGWERP